MSKVSVSMSEVEDYFSDRDFFYNKMTIIL